MTQATAARRKIGYLIPTFPRQTHIFFWREREALEALGADLDIVSTRRPTQADMVHLWSQQACARTTYLLPLWVDLLATLAELWRAGWGGWHRILTALFTAKGISGPSGKLRLSALALVGAKLAALARRGDWQHVHVHSCGDAAHIAMFAALWSGLPYSLTLHGPLADYGPNQAQKWQFARFGIVITQKICRELQQELGALLPPVEIAPMGVDLSTFARAQPYSPWQADDGTGSCRLFSCGRLNPCKGHADLIEAVALLRDRGLPVELEIAGGEEANAPGHRQKLEALIRERDLGACVRLLGAVTEETVRESLERAHIFLLASWSEPLGVATMEAMAMEVPAIVTGSGGVKELIRSDESGILVDAKSPDRLAAAVAALMADPEKARRLGACGRAVVVENFSSRRSAETILQALEAAASSEQISSFEKADRERESVAR